MIAKCPLCGSMASLIVIDSRELPREFGIRRRRECMLCKGRFTTYEFMKRRTHEDGTSGVTSGAQKPEKD